MKKVNFWLVHSKQRILKSKLLLQAGLKEDYGTEVESGVFRLQTKFFRFATELCSDLSQREGLKIARYAIYT
jgi:hypothetical protein